MRRRRPAGSPPLTPDELLVSSLASSRKRLEELKGANDKSRMAEIAYWEARVKSLEDAQAKRARGTS